MFWNLKMFNSPSECVCTYQCAQSVCTNSNMFQTLQLKVSFLKFFFFFKASVKCISVHV